MSQEDKNQHIIQRLTCLKDSSVLQTGATLNVYHSGIDYDGNTDQSFFFCKIPAQADALFEELEHLGTLSFEECRAFIRKQLGIK